VKLFRRRPSPEAAGPGTAGDPEAARGKAGASAADAGATAGADGSAPTISITVAAVAPDPACSQCGRTDLPLVGGWDPPICLECDAQINEDAMQAEETDR
jgi:hypothetical protein